MLSPTSNLGHSVFVMLNVDFGFLKRKIVIRFVCSDVRPLASQLNNFVVPSSPPPHIRSRPIYIISLRFHMVPISNLTLYCHFDYFSTIIGAWTQNHYHKVNRCLARYSFAPKPPTDPPTGHRISLHGLAQIDQKCQFWAKFGRLWAKNPFFYGEIKSFVTSDTTEVQLPLILV